ncbi:SPOR domain-containing protein [Qipengyuania sp. XHP0207]|uniref:SPOR domain-containing protein n=1 Tax=Qipengyuania sp. XHP0207 TaxID=3038078 RepID=UPI00241FFF03|nr:SPOR domain-containing protein [Qipengyuania sp. XHP0207]MDG5749148.1 SPOR domain-containing protein [Qipengyuania sp. XHP0207]
MSNDSKAKTIPARNARFVRLAVTTALATTALAGCTGKVAPSHNYSVAKAETALAKGKESRAIQHAEAAVLAAPRDAQTRTLLGNAYLEAGRFASAAETFGEAVELGDTATRTIISYTLSLTALGDFGGAQDVLRQYQNAIDPADFGLALSLAGQPQQGVHILNNALRSGQNTAKVRQNLAYALALSGDWRNARLVASQDVAGDQLDARLHEWAQMAQAGHPTVRVANLLGIEPVEDPGQPAMLALANHPAHDELAAEAAAQVDATAQVEPAGESARSDFALATELPAIKPAPKMDAAPAARFEDPEAVADQGEAALADAGMVVNGTRFVSRDVVQKVPAKAATKTAVAPRVAKAAKPAPQSSAIATLMSGDYNIQLGSYFSMSDAQAAWKLFQRRHPELSDAERVITKARVNGKIYYRVAAAGFAKASAQSMCRSVKRSGGGCIAYAASNPLPGALNVVRNEVRVASR